MIKQEQDCNARYDNNNKISIIATNYTNGKHYVIRRECEEEIKAFLIFKILIKDQFFSLFGVPIPFAEKHNIFNIPFPYYSPRKHIEGLY